MPTPRCLPGLHRLVAALRADTLLPDVSPEVWERLCHGRLGLVTHPSAVTADLDPAPEALAAAGARLALLFGPEHGVRGDAPDGQPVPSDIDARLGIPVVSLYGEQVRPPQETLAELDAILFDLQDVGARFYTFTTTLSHVMDAAAETGIPVVVLDRPNPIGGVQCEGPLLEPAHASFVGRFPIPIRHGLTLGELGRLFHRLGTGEEPVVVRVEGWTRGQYWRETGLPWVAPSPNMPTPETALVYPGTCLLEGTNVSEGRGTALPFEILGAPWLDAMELAAALSALALPGCRFRPVFFRPTASKYGGETCQGTQVHVTDGGAFRPVLTGVAILSVIRRLRPEAFAWPVRGESGRTDARTGPMRSQPALWTQVQIPPPDLHQARRRRPDTASAAGNSWYYPVDRLAGTSRLREAIDAGVDPREIAAEWGTVQYQFQKQVSDLWLYRTMPGSSA
ncbi:MAG: DUF1343 domain-containing protein [Armatimonadetes bacterium]|nr:DUF1343 domain-containing protein [Armatimonadota bacterium]